MRILSQEDWAEVAMDHASWRLQRDSPWSEAAQILNAH